MNYKFIYLLTVVFAFVPLIQTSIESFSKSENKKLKTTTVHDHTQTDSHHIAE